MGKVASWETAQKSAIVLSLVSCIRVESVVSLMIYLDELAKQGVRGSLKHWSHSLDLDSGSSLREV